jgi:hypothetical protein
MLVEIMALTRAKVSNKFMFLERIKGYISLEEDQSVDYIMDSVFDDISLRSCKNEANRLLPDQKGFLVYG